MNDIIKRIRIVFLDSGKSQTDIGTMIKKTPQYVWRLLNIDDINPSKSTIEDICRAFNIREEWMYNGEEPMNNLPEDETIAYVEELLGKEENPLYDLIRAIMKTYSESGPQEQRIIESFAKELKNNMDKENRG